jgi:hypothetical protein
MARMRHGLRALAAGGLGLAVSLLAACGSSSGLLSSTDASSLSSLIGQVSTDVSQGDCGAVPGDLGSLTQTFDNLPGSLNASLRDHLGQGVEKVRALALARCPSATSTPTTTTTATTTARTTTTPTTATTTSPARTTTTAPTTTATQPANTGTTSTGPGSGGTGFGNQGANGNGTGNGNGNGNGGNGG